MGLHQQTVLREYERELRGPKIRYPWPSSFKEKSPKTTSTQKRSIDLKNIQVQNLLMESPGPAMAEAR